MSLLESPAADVCATPWRTAAAPNLEVLGHQPVGIASLRRDVRGAILLVAAFFIAKGPPFDLASIKAVASGGTVISLSVIMGLPAVLAVLWLATRMARMPFADYLALRGTSWRDLVIGIVALIVLIAAGTFCRACWVAKSRRASWWMC